MKNASTIAGWVIFVLLPPLLLAWALDTGVSLNREAERRRSREYLSQFARTTMSQATTRSFIRRTFEQDRPPSWSSPAQAFEAGQPGSASTPLLDEMLPHLIRNTLPGPERYDAWRHQIGWEFDFHRFRNHPGIPLAVRWGRQEAWLVWSPAKARGPGSASARARLALYIPPSLAERLLACMPESAREQRIAWALVHPATRRWQADSTFDRRLIRPMLKAMNGSSLAVRRTDNAHIFSEQLEHDLVLMIYKSFPGWYIHTSSQMFWLFGFLLLVGLSALYPALVRVVPAWPLKYKFLGIFTYLVGLPLAGVAIFSMAVSGDRLHLKQTELRRLARSELLRFDDGLRDEIRSTQVFFRSIPNHPALQQRRIRLFMQQAREWVRTGRITRLEIRDWQNQPYIQVSSIRDDPGFEKFNSMIAQDVLQKHSGGRQIDEKTLDPLTVAYQAIVEHPEFGMTEVARKPETLVPFVLGKNWFFWFWSIGKDLNRPEAFFDFTRSHYQMARSYIRSHILRNRPIRLFVHDRRTSRWYPRPPPFTGLQDLCDGIARTRIEQTGRFSDGQRSWLALGIPGNRLENFDLIALVSEAEVLSEALNVRRFVGWGVGVAMLIGLFCALLLSESLLTPLGDLSGGINAISQRKADYRVPVRSRDEMGRMAQAFNRMIENIGDLDMAKVVQESLLPDSFPVPKGYEIAIWGRMTASVGGDYLDCIPLNDHVTAFMIGDVSGHGVSASLVMAMAKARVFSHFDEGGTEAGLLEQLNHLLFHLTTRRQLMTFCLVLVDFSSHQGTITAAGNPLPVFLQRSTGSVRHIGNIAYPLAVKDHQRFEPTPFTFAPGDLLLLYTDGVVEAIDARQRPYGYDRLHHLVQSASERGAPDFVAALQRDLSSHLGDCLPLDDITVLALSRSAIIAEGPSPAPDADQKKGQPPS